MTDTSTEAGVGRPLKASDILASEIPQPGARVCYHGSLTEEHGVYTVQGCCPCVVCDEDERWREKDPAFWRKIILLKDGQVWLTCVRRESVTVLEDGPANADAADGSGGGG